MVTAQTMQIIVELIAKDKGLKKTFNTMNKSLAQQKVITEGLTKRYNTFGKVMGMPMGVMRDFGKAGGTASMMTTRGARLGMRIRQLTHGFRGFRMELLGVMFFGMGIKKFFTGLLKPALELAGIMDIMRVILQLLFLPIALLLLPFFLDLLDIVQNLSPEMKMFIGIMTLLGVAIGSTLFLVAMFGLGLGSLAQMFGTTSAAAGGATASVTAFKSALVFLAGIMALGVSIAMLVVHLSNLKEAWTKNIESLSLFSGKGIHVGSIIRFLIGDFQGLQDVITGTEDGLRNLINFIKDTALAIFEKVSTGLKTIGGFFGVGGAIGITGIGPGGYAPVMTRGAEAANATVINYEPTYNVTGMEESKVRNMVEERDRSWIEEIARYIFTGGL